MNENTESTDNLNDQVDKMKKVVWEIDDDKKLQLAVKPARGKYGLKNIPQKEWRKIAKDVNERYSIVDCQERFQWLQDRNNNWTEENDKALRAAVSSTAATD